MISDPTISSSPTGAIRIGQRKGSKNLQHVPAFGNQNPLTELVILQTATSLVLRFSRLNARAVISDWCMQIVAVAAACTYLSRPIGSL